MPSHSPFQKEASEIIKALDAAYQKIDKINTPEIHWLKNKVLMDLKRHSTALKMQLGQEFEGEAKSKPEPLKRLFGKDIVVKPRTNDVNIPVNQTPYEVEEKELKEKVEQVFSKFLDADSDSIINSLNDLEIRGVAKKAGLPVTETTPKTITTDFVDQIRDAIRKQLAASPKKDPENTGTEGEEEQKLQELKESVEKLYGVIETMENKYVLDSYGDLEIRGVAKKAGLPVTEEEPKKITAKFLDQIRDAIKKQAEIENLGKQ